MACPTCDHTLECFGIDRGTQLFHCGRCGTVVEIEADGAHHPHGPKLVERCREFRAARHPSFKAEVGIFGDPVLAAEWYRLGIAESINLPGDRPQ